MKTHLPKWDFAFATVQRSSLGTGSLLPEQGTIGDNTVIISGIWIQFLDNSESPRAESHSFLV